MRLSSLEKHIQELNRYLNFHKVCWWIMDIENEPDLFYCNQYMEDVFNLDKSLPYHSVSNTCPIAGDYLKNVELKSSQQAKLILAEYQDLLNQKTAEYKNQFPYFDPRTNITHYFTSRAKILELNDQGEVAIIYGIIEDTTAIVRQYRRIKKQHKMFKELSETDPLTGLGNKRFFMKLLGFSFDKAQREQTELAVLMIDIDYFKLYNDYYGHLKGDQCLKQVANAIKNSLSRKTDIVARFGGEEFIIFFTGASAQQTLQLAELIKNNVELCQITHPKSPVSDYVTVSIGAYIKIPSIENYAAETFIKYADKNLYKAKSLGRNKTVINESSL
ncbi:diguanylate cyclase [Psychromonas ingrahamii 37]|uniref:diguanylate cyclase n=1 Tax=Psychromonas ingrahamii (strain DSM 17664 / CCUG 51855 / 37) TaxID=357804 RepID=A1SWM8_PSYIN|nr:diguanylate cyclase [Psychromonas ingrahamii]ABM03893.1 diguanylate cyclase [Psychromonas ingrahamii 37]